MQSEKQQCKMPRLFEICLNMSWFDVVEEMSTVFFAGQF